MYKAISRNYSAYVIKCAFTFPVAIIAAVGLSVISAINLSYYSSCSQSSSSCSALNNTITIAMLAMGIAQLVLNLTFRPIFGIGLFGSAQRSRVESLGYCESFTQLKYVCQNDSF